jgi:hypothetical protein
MLKSRSGREGGVERDHNREMFIKEISFKIFFTRITETENESSRHSAETGVWRSDR